MCHQFFTITLFCLSLYLTVFCCQSAAIIKLLRNSNKLDVRRDVSYILNSLCIMSWATAAERECHSTITKYTWSETSLSLLPSPPSFWLFLGWYPLGFRLPYVTLPSGVEVCYMFAADLIKQQQAAGWWDLFIIIRAETVRLCDYMYNTMMIHIIVQRVIVQRIRATSCHISLSQPLSWSVSW